MTKSDVAETTWLDATAQADLVRRGEVSPTDLTEAAVIRIEAINPRLDAVLRTRFDTARNEPDGDPPDGPFRSVPTLLEDIGTSVAGEPPAFGLGPLQDMRRPARLRWRTPTTWVGPPASRRGECRVVELEATRVRVSQD